MNTYVALKHIGGHACTSLIWTDICGIAAGKSCEKILQHNNCRRWIGARVQYSYLNLTREIDPSKLQTIELIMLWIQTIHTNQMSLLGRIFFNVRQKFGKGVCNYFLILYLGFIGLKNSC